MSSGQPAPVIISGLYAEPNEAWLALHDEPIIDPGLPIVDAHHHLWDRPGARYMFDDYLRDLKCGHNVVATVFIDCRSMYRAGGPQEYRALGEVEFARGMAAMSASGMYGPTRMCAGIVSHGSLQLGDDAGRVLEAMIEAGGGKFRGVRHVTAYDPDTAVMQKMASRWAGMLGEPQFRRGFAWLNRLGLSFDAFIFHHQIAELEDLALAYPETPIVLDHLGGFLGVGPYAGRQAEIFADWSRAITSLARCPNVSVKLGGAGMRMAGFEFHARQLPPGSEAIAAAWKPYVETCIQAFGPSRCMFESNFPPDKGSCSYAVLWNGFKRLAAGYGPDERADLFAGSAARFYRLDLPAVTTSAGK